MSLAPCPSCRRHVQLESERCPFCGAACSGLEPRVLPTRRLSRSALVTFASAVAVAGCGESVSLYGAPIPDTGTIAQDSGADATDASDSADDVVDTGPTAAPYGQAPLVFV
ncbi:MAG: hypothetical protein ACXWUG_29410 [Polyangiales bacterium]